MGTFAPTRRAALGVLIGSLSLGGCATRALAPVNADGTYCYRTRSIGRRTCTAMRVPSRAAEEQASAFAGDADALTIYVVRQRWGDGLNVLPLSIDGVAVVETVPFSFVRVRARPGEHRLEFEWDGRRSTYPISGTAGDVRYVQLVGSFWSWGGTYRWLDEGDEAARQRAARCKLVADVDLRG
jgi:hypothetical protein